MAKYTINLFQPELVTKQPLMSLGRVVLVWGVALLVVLSMIGWSQYRIYELAKNNKVLSNKADAQNQEMAGLERKITKNIADPALVSKLALIKVITANKQALQQQLSDKGKTYAGGFSSAMTQLAQLHNRDISLQKINISATDITFSGLAKSAGAVPGWLAGFEQSNLLSGRTFVSFDLLENSDQLIEFIVSTAEVQREVEEPQEP